MYSKRSEKWLPVTSAYSQAGTLVRVFATGYGNGDICGRVHVTYYVKLRAPNL